MAKNVKARARPIRSSKVKGEKPKPSSNSNNCLCQESNPGHHFTGHSATIAVGYDALPLSFMSLEVRAEYSSLDLIQGIGVEQGTVSQELKYDIYLHAY